MMNQHIARYREVSRLNYFAWSLAAMWTAVVTLSLGWNLTRLRPEAAVGLWWGHGLLWLLGLGVMIVGFHRLRVAQNRIVALMCTDPLTGIANRRIFLESLGGAISYAHRHQTPLSLVMADLDNFKLVNDGFGHSGGDAVLQAFAGLLAATSRQEDLAARFGGEEFVMMLPGAGAEEAAVLAERLRHQWEMMAAPAFSIRVTASFGVAAYQPGESLDGVIDRADQALYEAKTRGKNQVVVQTKTTEQLEQETLRLCHFFSLLAQESEAMSRSSGRRPARPLRAMAGKRSFHRRS
jgi:diguanylate cyclase (GGDEF)-like protein